MRWKTALLMHEFIVYEREPGEVKHLSSQRKRKKPIANYLSCVLARELAISGLLDSQSSGERNGTSLNPIYLELDEGAASQDARARFLFDGFRTNER